eukprot:TRINITY_DN12558_c0_g1_i1.p1 TRINITY_DN12558_c0_g1~~TRINITY_DN12558_c0_g1_i1.p1  ORF type:complete len:900 (-),score=102.41 TRINITY_DN12558_c0_g1_i1:190-2850(-)
MASSNDEAITDEPAQAPSRSNCCQCVRRLFEQIIGVCVSKQEPNGGMDNVWLRFSPPAREAAFTEKYLPDSWYRIMSACAVLLCWNILKMTNLEMSRSSHEREADVRHFSLWAMLALTSVAFLVAAVITVPRFRGSMRTEVHEFLIVMLAFSTAVTESCTIRAVSSVLLGFDPAEVSDFNALVDQTHLVLVLIIIVGTCHFLMPVRWRFLVVLEVTAILLYTAYAVLLSSFVASDIDPVKSVACFTMVILMISHATRSRERQERIHFALDVKAKIQDCLAQKNSFPPAARDGQDDDKGSKPSTSPSGLIFEEGADSLNEILTIGVREQWLIHENEVELCQDIGIVGSGSFGVVNKAFFLGAPVAIKRQLYDTSKKNKKSGKTTSTFIEQCNELRIMRRLRHPNIVSFYGATISTSVMSITLVLEYVDGHNLSDLIRGKDKDLDSIDRLSILSKVCCALTYLHSRTPVVVHGDLKGSNVVAIQHETMDNSSLNLIGAGRYFPKLLDFGLSRVVTRGAKNLGGTPGWVAPEVMQKSSSRDKDTTSSGISSASDVFSLGCLCQYVWTGQMPRSRRGKKSRGKRGSEAGPLTDWTEKDLSDGRASINFVLRPLVESCLAKDPSGRPRAAQMQRNLAALIENESEFTAASKKSISEDGAANGASASKPSRVASGSRTSREGRSRDGRSREGRSREGRSREGRSREANGSDSEGSSGNLGSVTAAGFMRHHEDRPSTSSRAPRLAAVPEVEVLSVPADDDSLAAKKPLPPFAFQAFSLTPKGTQTMQTLDMLSRWNVRMAACCTTHSACLELLSVCWSICDMTCMEDDLPEGQCSDCLSLVFPDDVGEARLLGCALCGQRALNQIDDSPLQAGGAANTACAGGACGKARLVL